MMNAECSGIAGTTLQCGRCGGLAQGTEELG